MLPVRGVADQEVTVGIRPEGFVLDANGPMSCRPVNVEVMGRDISVVCGHPNFTGENFRAIIDSDELKFTSGTTISFQLKPHKVFLFQKGDGRRIRI